MRSDKLTGHHGRFRQSTRTQLRLRIRNQALRSFSPVILSRRITFLLPKKSKKNDRR